MARPMKPTGAKILKGTFRKCRANPHEPIPSPVEGIPKPPRKLSKEARKEWDRVIEYVINNKIVGSEGLGPLATYCNLHALLVDMEKKNIVPEASFLAQYRAFAGAFGLTGDSRAKMKSPKQDDKPANRWEALK